jgi:glutaconate CoA-transferase subunit A
MSAREAVARFVHDGDRVFLGYTSWAGELEREIARQRKRRLMPVATVGSLLLPLAGCADRFITSYLLGARSPYFTERWRAGEFQVEDYTNQTIALMLMAGALGIPFIPTRSFLGTDYLDPRYLPQPGGFLGEKKLHVMDSPFGGERVVLLPAMRLDVSCVHVQQADEEGNAVFWGGHGEVRWALWASERIVISAEEIVPAGELRSDPHRVIVPGFMVSAVVHAPFGALPWGVPGYYGADARFQADYLLSMRSEEGFARVMAEWVDGCPDHASVLAHHRQRYGDGALEALRANRTWEPARTIRYGWRGRA